MGGFAVIWLLSAREPTGGAPGLLTVLVLNASHVVLFGVLALLVHLALDPAEPRRWLCAWLVAAAYGVVDELHQRFVPGRDSSVWDVLTDVAGALLFASLATWLWTGAGWARAWAVVAVPAAALGVALATWL